MWVEEAPYLEANLPQRIAIDEQSSIEQERGLAHLPVNDFPIDRLELLPFGRDHNCLGILGCFEDRVYDSHGLLDYMGKEKLFSVCIEERNQSELTVSERNSGRCFLQIGPDLRLLNLERNIYRQGLRHDQ